MFSRIECLNFRCLRYINQPLGPFHVLVGPNASGKTTFLSVIEFLSKLVDEGVEAATRQISGNFLDLLWQRKGKSFQLAVEAFIPDEKRFEIADESYTTLRYQVQIGLDAQGQLAIIFENLSLCLPDQKPELQLAGRSP